MELNNLTNLKLQPRQLDAVYGAFLHNSGHAIAILNSPNGKDFTVTDANPAECSFGMRTREDLIGTNLQEAYPQLCDSGITALIQEVWKHGKTKRVDPTYYEDSRLNVWVKGYISKLPDDNILVVLEDVTDEIHRSQQQALELVILSELRNTSQLSQIIPKILNQLKEHFLFSHACLYLLPKYTTDAKPTHPDCAWNYCDCVNCAEKSPLTECGGILCPHQQVLSQSGDPSHPFFTKDGSFWFQDLDELQENESFLTLCPSGHIISDRIKSGCIVALRSGDDILGLLQVISTRPYAISETQAEFIEVVGASIGMALGHQYAETQLRTNEHKIQAILDSMPAMLNALDEEGKVIYWNKECERVTGYSAAEAMSAPSIMTLLYPEPSYREIVTNTWINQADFKNKEFSLTTKTGKERIISWSNVSHQMPIPGWNHWAVGQDITHLQKTEHILQGVLEGTSRETGTIFFRNLTKNLAQTLGVKFALISETLPNSPACGGTRAFWAGTEFGDNFIYSLEGTPCEKIDKETLCLFDGNVAQLFPKEHLLVEMGVQSFAGIRLLDSGDNVLGFLAIMDTGPLHEKELIGDILKIFSARAASELERQHTVEEQQHLEAQLRQSQKMEAVGQLAGGIAHDFNNLLQAISGYTELAAFAIGSSHMACDDLKEVQRAAGRARDLVQQLLSFSSRQILHPQILGINEVIDSTYQMIHRIIGEQIEFEFKPCDLIQPVRADRGQIDQIIINLCVNARDAMPHGGKLRITTSAFEASERYCRTHPGAFPGSYTCFSVSDNGIGMPSDIKEHIFEPFFSTKGLGKGTGLGLSTAFGIVAQHKGFIHVDSSTATGTTFEIFLPVSGSPIELGKELSINAPLKKVGSGETILFAEDEEIVRDLGTTVMKNAGYKVLTAYDGEHAIELFNQHADDISFAVLDVVMPRKSGPEVAKFIKAKHPDIPVLFTSGYRFNLLENEIPHIGCELISKPFSPHQLLKTISDMLTSAHTKQTPSKH